MYHLYHETAGPSSLQYNTRGIFILRLRYLGISILVCNKEITN